MKKHKQPGPQSGATASPNAAAVQMPTEQDQYGNAFMQAQVAQEVADKGVQGGGSSLPHLAQIQAAFGHHDITGVQAHIGGAAAQANQTLGAQGYATGNQVAFGGAPNLHTAAHEAAHIVQQRGGVSLKGGFGQSGDTYEKHADRVADQVVAGNSAEGLLDQMSGGGGGGGVQFSPDPKLPKGKEGFAEMWEAHPHNYQEDSRQDTSSHDLREEEGLPHWLANTCAIRLSVMLNSMGGSFRITPENCKAAGLKRKPWYSKKSGNYYILAAKEMWEYIAARFRPADSVYPANGRWKTEEEFTAAWEGGIRDEVKSKKGIVGFDKIFGYGGTGHVDIFDGETLSDAGSWYECHRLHLWYIVP